MDLTENPAVLKSRMIAGPEISVAYQTVCVWGGGGGQSFQITRPCLVLLTRVGRSDSDWKPA